VLEPAIDHAQHGFPMYEYMHRILHISQTLEQFQRYPAGGAEVFYPGGQVPAVGSLFVQPQLGQTLRLLVEAERAAPGPRRAGLQAARRMFYEGEIARRLAAFSERVGGLLRLEDLQRYQAGFEAPIRTTFAGYEICTQSTWTQAAVLLQSLNMLEHIDVCALGHNSPAYIHTVTEVVKLAFADRERYYGDPNFAAVPIAGLLSKAYAAARRRDISLERASDYVPGNPAAFGNFGNTVYVTCVDSERNVVSLIHSLFESISFGSGVVAGDTGICLQNRGASFVADPDHPNVLTPGKRPFQTIIPAMILKDERPWLCYGVMGGDMQVQGHVQVALNMIDFAMNVQEAIEAPRYRIMGGLRVALERAIPPPVRDTLAAMGHVLTPYGDQSISYGGGQAILIDEECGVLQGGSDYRKDGCAIGY
jgi:gamma-glutamyltranspeptidase/glutathione hydrolase